MVGPTKGLQSSFPKWRRWHLQGWRGPILTQVELEIEDSADFEILGLKFHKTYSLQITNVPNFGSIPPPRPKR